MSNLFDTLKSLSFYVQVGASIGEIEALRLETSLRMLKTAHFNAKMNALKEVKKSNNTFIYTFITSFWF